MATMSESLKLNILIPMPVFSHPLELLQCQRRREFIIIWLFLPFYTRFGVMEGEEERGEEGVGGYREAEGKRGGLGSRERRGMRVIS